VQAPAILHRHLSDDVPDVRLVRPTRALVRRCDREWRPRLQVGRPRTRPRAGGALDRCRDSAADRPSGWGTPGGGIEQAGVGVGAPFTRDPVE
jgi:hypothetical protein